VKTGALDPSRRSGVRPFDERGYATPAMRTGRGSRESELQVGGRLGPYSLEAYLGEGGMGTVFRAVREHDGQLVALKILKAKLTGDDVYRRRFAHEARAAREVKHRHLVPIVEAGEIDGRHYVAVSYVAGRTLEERIRADGALPLEDLLRLAAEIGAGLDALHEHGLVHRDVKPSNILIAEDGSAALTDFGLAKGPAYTVLTKQGQVMGTLDYLAPELIKGEPATSASDIYALGCVVVECISRNPPFAHKSVFQVAMAHLEEDPPDPCLGRNDLPAGLCQAALAALAKNPARRPPTGTAYAVILRIAAYATPK